MIQHILHSSLLAVLLYGVYHLFLRKETFFQWNRAYLLAIPLLSITIPFLSAPFSIDMTPTVIDEVVPLASVDIGNVSMISEQPITIKTSKPIDYKMIAVSIYSIGAFISLLFFLYNVSSIKEIIRLGTTHFKDGIWITKTSQKLTAFSFFKNIVIDENLDSKKVDEILNHEIIHVKQCHSWDLMAFEVYKIIFWFHPICYIAQKELKQVHEYIVDDVLIKNQESITYQESLLKTVFGTEQFSLASSYFNKSLLKNRILMLQKKKSTAKALFKLAFLLPIVLGSLIFTACNEEPEFIEETIVLDDSNNYGIVKRSEFKAGLKDYYLNISKEDKKFIEEIVNNNSFEIKKEDSIKIRKLATLFPILMKNGTTIILDDIDNTGIISAHESPFDKDVRFDGFPLEYHLNMTKKEYANFVKYISINYPNTTHSYTDGYNDGIEAVDFDIPFSKLEEVPHFEDCTGTQVEIKKCTVDKITSFVNENFNTEIAKDLPGRHKIAVQFKIDKNGNVTGVQSKAKSIELQNEAARVINKLPKMIPGKQKGKAVTTIYALPIIFEIKE
ncbi:beta-lactamase regulating signal transducer with metallopeptidase domain [Nonlabens xylanidelens]|uniref:Beta-lactamase regulating signal transducer with metallopeptidase domain n=1 Tax=Nonlabens xylanidelens TaxID=191564 RepID=A0A2S6IGG8_9FLAO|nr:M56 family metallopeptidase [Nonlabens xylanidelens]PPK93315.1 beta-lactamase regulating signal transducer with metallopeptidase domain [Nonlabens xylanidelens]PQJ20867.1 hypothetical protein BST94_05085 [Nonlabens xylanidelens]